MVNFVLFLLFLLLPRKAQSQNATAAPATAPATGTPPLSAVATNAPEAVCPVTINTQLCKDMLKNATEGTLGNYDCYNFCGNNFVSTCDFEGSCEEYVYNCANVGEDSTIMGLVVGCTKSDLLGTRGTSSPPSGPQPSQLPSNNTRETLGIRASVERVFGRQVLADPESPYSKALNWITFDDPMQLIPSDPNFIQRYTAAYFYFATTKDGPWRSCNPPENAWNESPACIYKKLTLLFPETFDDVPWNAWLSNSNECKWAGVVCDSQGQFRSIDLSAGYLSGPFPEGIYNLPFLQELSLYWNNMTGTLPSKGMDMKHLVSLELHYNHFTGTVPSEWWNATNLQRINIGDNMISGTISKEVGNLRNVKGLFIFTNMLTGTIPRELGVLESVTYLRGSDNSFVGTYPQSITNLTNVVELWMHRNLMSGTIPEDMNRMKLLADLRLHVNHHTGTIPETVWDLPVLERFELNDNYITGTLSSNIAKLGEQLYLLHVSDNFMSGPLPTEISQLSNVWSLWLHGNDFTGTIPQALCDLKGDALQEILGNFTADCAPDSGGLIQLTCPDGCCTICCKPDGSDCLERGSGTAGSTTSTPTSKAPSEATQPTVISTNSTPTTTELPSKAPSEATQSTVMSANATPTTTAVPSKAPTEATQPTVMSTNATTTTTELPSKAPSEATQPTVMSTNATTTTTNLNETLPTNGSSIDGRTTSGAASRRLFSSPSLCQLLVTSTLIALMLGCGY